MRIHFPGVRRMRHGWRAWRCRGKGGGQSGTVHGEREADRDGMAGNRWRRVSGEKKFANVSANRKNESRKTSSFLRQKNFFDAFCFGHFCKYFPHILEEMGMQKAFPPT
jgi:hypothetical protein